jgi:hypothetical protein
MDDTFNVDKKRTIELCKLIIDKKLNQLTIIKIKSYKKSIQIKIKTKP